MLTTSFRQNRLHEVVAERGVKVRYACESGSRGWGLASTDSDYDVRFIYQHPREWYLQPEEVLLFYVSGASCAVRDQ
jgi:predicted nucleotidyltransferase